MTLYNVYLFDVDRSLLLAMSPLCVQDDGLSRAELEARVRMELNNKLASINTFLQQHAEQCHKIDDMRDSNHDEIRQQLRLAEQQLRVCSTLLCYI